MRRPICYSQEKSCQKTSYKILRRDSMKNKQRQPGKQTKLLREEIQIILKIIRSYRKREKTIHVHHSFLKFYFSEEELPIFHFNDQLLVYHSGMQPAL